MEVQALHLLIRITCAVLAAALGMLLVWRAINRGRVGRPIWRVKRRRSARVALLLAATLVAAGVVAGSELGRGADALTLLALSLALIAVCPGFQDSVFGADGVQRGWYARRLGQLESWRLIGEHLRWKLHGEWLATDVPVGEHAGLRARLEREAPGRESLHGNAGFDPQRSAAAKSKT